MLGIVDLFIFLFGIIIGSFLNVVIFRYNTGRGVGGRSACLVCVKQLAWYELVPVFSYLFQRGRCRKCLSAISIQYPLVELATGGLFVALAHAASDPYAVAFSWIYFACLLVIAVYDYRHFIIPDGFVYASIALGFLSLVARSGNFFADLFSALALALFFVFVWAGSKGEWMGFGDAKLALAIGFFLPFPLNLNAIIFSFWTGAAIGVLALLFQKKGMKSQIPFAPFLVLGTLISYLWHVSLW